MFSLSEILGVIPPIRLHGDAPTEMLEVAFEGIPSQL